MNFLYLQSPSPKSTPISKEIEVPEGAIKDGIVSGQVKGYVEGLGFKYVDYRYSGRDLIAIVEVK